MNHLFVDNLTVIDFAYLDPTRGLVGESWIADVILTGELDEQGMVFDFSAVKRTIKRIIDERVDHRLVIPKDYSGLRIDEEAPGKFEWQLKDGTRIVHRSPQEAVVFIDGDVVVPSVVASMLEKELKAVLPANVQGVQIELREEEIDGAYYHYVHGLKKHLGNCQRIAHGHRSPIQVRRNGHRDTDLERDWARCWSDIYVGSEEDVTEQFVDAKGIPYITFDYEAEQGEFSLTLPLPRVYMMATDTTVELIADHIASQCKTQYPDDEIQVKAFEGVGKGAFALR
ncbi:6-pyruvoyl trahydropterin synthase family protein [Marinobacter changyiensis]|uniref:6-pyruvoyl trahydropterin synthase family protein n=1 Tax=Marinobacter changyiensis TaxID=2604091 RepID=UPI0012641CE5|nr:6-carboxytetrahydropterin synthase [Marinobacter changyiensis]